MKNNSNLLKSLISVWLSRKLWMTLISFGLMFWIHEKTINHLYTLIEPHQCSAVTTIYITTIGVIGVILAAYLGTNALQTKFGISGAAQLVSESLNQNINDKKEENINIKEERIFKEYIINQDDENAPKIKPFSVAAREE